MTVEEKRDVATGPPGVTYGSYRVLKELGRGGMGVVYLTQHAIMGKQAAVKVLLPEFSGREDLVMRFFNEARAAARLDHPAFVEVFDCGIASGNAFMVMEYVPGESLATHFNREGRLPFPRAVLLARTIADAMAVAHESGIVHRDLKPDNIMLTAATKASRVGPSPIKILDFGIAKLNANAGSDTPMTRTGTLMGTPLYMSPEQCKGAGGIDGRSDIYSLGCILYALVTGVPPFRRDGDGEIIVAHILDPVERLERHGVKVPPRLEEVLMKALAKDPAHRHQTMAELVADLDTVGDVTSVGERTGAPRVATQMAAAVAATMTAAAGGGPVVIADETASPAPDRPSAIMKGSSTTFSSTSGEVAVVDQVARGGVRRPLLWVGLAATLVAGVSGVVIATRHAPSRPTAAVPAHLIAPPRLPPPTLTPATPAPAPASVTPAPPSQVTLNLDSDPPGARVINAADRSVLGTTPLRRSLAKGGRTLNLVIEKRGFRPETVKVDLDSDSRKTVPLQQKQRQRVGSDLDDNRKL